MRINDLLHHGQQNLRAALNHIIAHVKDPAGAKELGLSTAIHPNEHGYLWIDAICLYFDRY